MIGWYRDAIVASAVKLFGPSAAEFTLSLLILVAFPLFLGPALVGARRADQIKTICPVCDADLSLKVDQLLTTRSCPTCGEQVVAGGTVRAVGVYKRYRALQSRTLLKYWFWAWPSIGLLACATWLVEHNALQQCPQSYFLAPLIGTATTGWAWIRTFDSLYVPPLLASIVVLSVGGMIFWHSI